MKLTESICRIESRIEDLLGRVRPPFIFLAGLLFCVGLVILPEVLPAMHGREGYVWSPVHSQNYRLGDLYYYGAWLKEVLDTGLPAYSPSAGELSGQPLIETWRFLGLILAAIPGYIITDIRTLIVFDYGLSAALFFSIGYLFAYTFTRNCWIGLIAGISVLFMTDRLWVPIAPYVGTIVDIWRIPASALNTIIGYINNVKNVIDYDIYGNTFRFINISLSAPILLFYYFITVLAYKRGDIRSFIMVFVMSPLMAFTYPSHLIIAYGLIMTFSLVSLFRRNWKSVIAFVLIGISTLVFLELINYRQMLTKLFNESQLWNNIFSSEKLALINSDIIHILSVMLTSKYLLTFLLMIYLTKKWPIMRDIVFATGMVAVPLSSVYLFDMPQLWTRFVNRGIDHIWFMLVIVVTIETVRRYISEDSNNLISRGIKWNNLRRLSLKTGFILIFFVILFFSGYGFAHIAMQTTSNEGRFIKKTTWEAYQWIDKNIPRNAEVATLDWEDITLLPIFTKVNLVVGHNVIDGRSLTEELKRFVATWKFLGYSRSKLEKLLDMGPETIKILRHISYKNHYPRMPEEEFDASQFMLGILYWPHINKIENIQIVKNGSVTSEFRNIVLNMYDKARTSEYVKKYNVQYLTMSSEQVALLGIPSNTKLLYKNRTRLIFALKY